MKDQQVFAYLMKQKKEVLLDYLHAAFDVMDAKQRRDSFAGAVGPLATTAVDGRRLRRKERAWGVDPESLRAESLHGKASST